MKVIFTFFMLVVCLVGMAQPDKIHYQAVAVGANGKPMKNSTVGLRLSVLDSLPTGTNLFTETQTASTDASGMFSIYLGGGTATAGTFANLPWANGNDKFLKVEMDAQGGSNYQPMGITQLVSVPYAMASKVADTAQVAKEIEIGTVIRGNAGRTWQLTESINGPSWKCYPPITQANAGADQLNVCGNTVTIIGNTSAGMTPAWSIISGTGGSFGTPNSPSTMFTGLRGNSYTLRYSISNACGSSFDNVAVSLAPTTTTPSNAGPDQRSLAGTSIATLAANTPAVGETGAWSMVAGSGGSFSANNNPTATFTKGADSSYTLVWTIAGPCANSSDTVFLLFPATVRNVCGQTVTYAGEIYPTVQIGTQCWFAKNLNVGSMINGSSDQTNNSTMEKYCYNNVPANCTTYGGLYQWAEAVQYQNGASNTSYPSQTFSGNIKGICPMGWHMPSDAEYCTLTTFLDTTVDCDMFFGWTGTDIGGKMKSTSSLWTSPNNGATNSSGFSAMPGGVRSNNTMFGGIGDLTYFWYFSEYSATDAFCLYLYSQNSLINRLSYPKNLGLSVRCTQD